MTLAPVQIGVRFGDRAGIVSEFDKLIGIEDINLVTANEVDLILKVDNVEYEESFPNQFISAAYLTSTLELIAEKSLKVLILYLEPIFDIHYTDHGLKLSRGKDSYLLCGQELERALKKVVKMLLKDMRLKDNENSALRKCVDRIKSDYVDLGYAKN